MSNSITIPCPVCGHSHQRARGGSVYCSPACRLQAASRTLTPAQPAAPRSLTEVCRSVLTEVCRSVQAVLTPELLRAGTYTPTGKSNLEGHCYHAAEAVYHLAGGKAAGLTPVVGKLGGGTHWWLVQTDGSVVDPTAAQLPDGYAYQGRRCGFLTRQPSKRARTVIERVKTATGATP